MEGESHMQPTEQMPVDVLRELVKIRYQQEDWRRWRERTPDITAALRAVDKDQVHSLANELWEQYEHEEILPFLGQLTASVLGALAGWSETFIDQGHILPSWLYLDAPPTTTKRLLGLLDHPAFADQRNGLLLALAWIGDDLVRDQFRAWREDPPPWTSQLYIAPHAYAAQAGWELTTEGGRRDLYLPTCYELIVVDEPERTPSRHAVATSTPTETSCGWCGRELVALLDFDLRDPRCAFVSEGLVTTDPAGARLRIAHCL
jgi:hypothetical protein